MNAKRFSLDVPKWEYQPLIDHLCRVIGRPLKKELRDDIEMELRKLQNEPWNKTLDVVISLMHMGGNELRNSLWTNLLSAVQTQLESMTTAQGGSAKAYTEPWERIDDYTVGLERLLMGEMQRWLAFFDLGKPLIYDGKPVVRMEGYFSPYTIEQYMTPQEQYAYRYKGEYSPLKIWLKAGCPTTYCVLMDSWFHILHGALVKEYDKDAPDNNALRTRLKNFVAFLQKERERQILERMKSPLHKEPQNTREEAVAV